MVASMGMALVVIFWRGLMTITLALGFQPQTSAAFYPASFRLLYFCQNTRDNR